MNRSISLGILLGFATIGAATFYGGGANASTSSLDHEQLQFITSTPASRVGGDDTSRTGPEEQEPQRRTAPEEEEKDISPLLRPEEDQEDQGEDQFESPCPEGTVLSGKGIEGECVSPDFEGESSFPKAAPIAISGNNVYIAWPTNNTGNDEVMFRVSNDMGATFADKINLSKYYRRGFTGRRNRSRW
jgi:hypothetical protein